MQLFRKVPYATILIACAITLIQGLRLLSEGQYDLIWSNLSVPSWELLYKQPWRILTSPFLHQNIPHYLENLAFLLLFGIQIEHKHGRGYLANYDLEGKMHEMMINTQPERMPYRLNGRALIAGRLGYALMLLFCVSMFALSLSYKFVKDTSTCHSVYNVNWGESCTNWYSAMNELGLTAVVFESYFLGLRLMAAAPFFILSLILVWRHGHELRVLLLAALLPVMGMAGTWFNPFWYWANGWFELSGYSALTVLPQLLTYFLSGGSMLLVCLFPNGRFVPRWSRWLAGSWLLLLAGNLFLYDTVASWGNWPVPLNTLVPLSFLCLGVAVVIIRYRRQATAVQRQQIKWVTFGLLLMALNVLLDFSLFVIYPAITGQYPLTTARQSVLWELGQDTFSHISQFILGICFMVAVLRHRLWGNRGLW